MDVDTQFLLFLATGALVGVLIALYRYLPGRRARILAFIPGLVILLLGILILVALPVSYAALQGVLLLALAAILLIDAAAARTGPFTRQIWFGGALALASYAWVAIECVKGAA